MILWLVGISAVLAFVFYIYIANRPTSVILTLLMVATLIVSLFFMVKSDRDHYGMHQVTTTETKTVYPISKTGKETPLKMVLYQPVGSKGKEQVYIYQTAKAQKKPSHTLAKLNVHNTVKTTSSTSKLVQKTTRWEYKSNMAKFWFGVSENGGKRVRTDNTFYINKDWAVLTTTQAKKLQKASGDKAAQAKMKAAGKAFVQQKVMAAMQQNPTMSAADRQKLIKQATAEFQAQAMKKAIDQIKAEK